jgi:hypothetical protein
MASNIVVRYQTTVDSAEENQRLVQQVYAELNETRPDGIRYMTLRLADGVTFLHVSLVTADENPLSQTAAFAQFQADLPARVVEGPQPSAATVVGSYGF